VVDEGNGTAGTGGVFRLFYGREVGQARLGSGDILLAEKMAEQALGEGFSAGKVSLVGLVMQAGLAFGIRGGDPGVMMEGLCEQDR